jgi:hypothetical protein
LWAKIRLEEANMYRVPLSLILVLSQVTILVAAEPPARLLNLPLVYSDDFESGDVLARWQPSEPKAWKLIEQNGNHVLSQFQHIETKTPVRSPFNRSVVKDVVVSNCVLDVRFRVGVSIRHRWKKTEARNLQ